MISLIGRITCRYCCPAFVRPKSDSGMMVNAIPESAKKCSASARNPCSPSSRNRVRHHPGNPFTLSPESRSPSPGIRIRPQTFCIGCSREWSSRVSARQPGSEQTHQAGHFPRSRHAHAKPAYAKKDALTPSEVNLFRRWIRAASPNGSHFGLLRHHARPLGRRSTEIMAA